MSNRYEPASYWESLHQALGGTRAVGYPGLPESLNRARYDVELLNVDRALRAAGVGTPEGVVDVGAGTGIWLRFWRSRGAKEIVGVDLSETAVKRLRAEFPGTEIILGDITDPELLPAESADVVSAMSVLLHITDDKGFECALRSLARLVRAGGALVLVEPAVVHSQHRPAGEETANSKARPLALYERILRESGLSVVEIRPVSVLLTNVVDTRFRLSYRILELYWLALCLVIGTSEWRGQIAARALRPIDAFLTRSLQHGPSSKVIVARRPSHPDNVG